MSDTLIVMVERLIAATPRENIPADRLAAVEAALSNAKARSRTRNGYKFSEKAQRHFEDSARNNDQAHDLLDLINAEFQGDPTSTACFDRRIVDGVAYCVALRKALREKSPF